MAKLEDFIPEPQSEFKSSTKQIFDVEIKNKAVGKKRRVWLEDDTKELINSTDTTPIQKGSIKGVYKPGLSTLSIDPFYRPLLEKGSIKGVYRPLFLCLADLRNNPLQIIRFLFELTENENGYKTDCNTKRVRLMEIMQAINISKDSARTALRFLLKQKLISRIEFKPGKTGWSKYEIKKSLFDEIKNALKKGSIDPFKVIKKPAPQKGSNSSSSNKNITTNNIDPFNVQEIDVTPLEEIGLTQNHLLQLRTKTTTEIIQQSINHFAFALQHNLKAKKYKSPIATFISVLKRGEMWIEADYRSPQEIAQIQLLKSKETEKNRIKQLEESSYKLAFEEWKETLTVEQIREIAQKKKGDIRPHDVKLSSHFREFVWKDKKKEYLVS